MILINWKTDISNKENLSDMEGSELRNPIYKSLESSFLQKKVQLKRGFIQFGFPYKTYKMKQITL